MIEHMPGHSSNEVEAPRGTGYFAAQAGYVDRGPRREDSDERSVHVELDYDPTGVDTRYDKAHPKSILGRARRENDYETLDKIARGRMEDGR